MAKVSVSNLSSTELLAEATTRTYKVIITNLDATNTVWVNIGATAVADTGFAVVAGQTIVLDASKGELGAVFNAIAETGATNVDAYRVS